MPTAGQRSKSEKNHLRLSETANLWQPRWNESQTALARATHMLGRIAGLLEGAVSGSCSLRIVKQSQCKGYCCLRRDRMRGCEGGNHGGTCLWKKARQPWKQGNIAESCIGVKPSP